MTGRDNVIDASSTFTWIPGTALRPQGGPGAREALLPVEPSCIRQKLNFKKKNFKDKRYLWCDLINEQYH